ncbi:MAG: type IX secretion system sortase PorU, partial [Candidatus Zixiibacteriota bacterium]
PPYFDYCEIEYTGNLKPNNDILDAFFTGLFGTAEYIINDAFSAAPMIFNIDDPLNPVNIANYMQNSGEITLQIPSDGDGTARLYFCPSSKFYTTALIEKVSAPLLTENPAQTDLIIVAPRQFVSMLDDYKQYRENHSGLKVMVVSLEDIMNQFSYGLYDPAAVRDFLRYAYLNFPEPAPSAVLLVGDASYDFEDNLSTETPNYIPPFIHELDHTASDDNYVYFGEFGFLDGDSSYLDGDGDRGYDMMVSRWPVRNSVDLNTITDKVRSYESSTNYGTWRTTIALVADDEYTSGGDYEGLTHTRQTELLETGHLPPAFRRNKVYSWEYPFNSERAKPDVNEAIVKSVNEGTLLINYVGHGNPDTWAHERIFLKGTDLPKLTNAERLSLFYAASCSIGLFDDPRREGMAEELLRMSGGGAIGVMAATRLVYSGDNGALNRQVFDILFYADDLSICEALYAAKTYRQYSSGFLQQRLNDRKFSYLGDPILRLGTPRYSLSFTEFPAILKALDTPFVAGEVVDAVTGSHVNMNGHAEIFVYDSELKKTHLGVNDDGDVVDSLTYAKSGPIVYKGSVEIADGYFDFSFIVPLDIGYGGEGAAIFAYAVSDVKDGFGLADSIPVSSEVVISQDSLGPLISYTFGTRENFVSGDRIAADEPLVLTLTDSTGINLTGGAGHGITLCIDNAVENIINLTDLFQYDAGSYTSGEIRYEMASLSAGNHTFKVKAWDNANNSATTEFEASVAETGEFVLTDVLNYPNPMEERTTFSFSLTFPARKVSLEIFTLSGRKIMNYEENMVSADYHEFYTWNGHDADGDRVATGVYIYKVTAFSMNTDDVIESFGKVVVVN